MTRRPLAAVILAAGVGKRMCADLPKVLHEIAGRPMLDFVLGAVEAVGVGVERIYVIVGHEGDRVQHHVGSRARCIEQAQRLGTAHAVLQAKPQLDGFDGDVLITCGDTPLITAQTMQRLIDAGKERGGTGAVLAARLTDPTGYGRVICDAGGAVERIIEQKDCTEEQRAIDQINVGTYCLDCSLLFEALAEVANENAQGEYYLTDVPRILHERGKPVRAVLASDESESLGVNDREQLATAAGHLRRRALSRLMERGVTIIDPATTYVEDPVDVGRDTVVEPFTLLRGLTVIGERCRIGPHCELIDARVGDGAVIRHSLLEGVEVPAGGQVGPFEHQKAPSRSTSWA